eukprot:4338082-Pyramimonas_sp.AAC.1
MTVHSYLLACQSARISETLGARPVRLRSCPLRGRSFMPEARISRSPEGRGREEGLKEGTRGRRVAEACALHES